MLPYIALEAIFDSLSLIRKNSPLVHNITNYVAMPTIANMLLALGASPLMAHALEELPEISNIAQALALNIGTLDQNWLQAMQQAQKLAQRRSIPVILDPVGAGASKYRTQSVISLLEAGIDILRGNSSEIIALVNENVITKGVDTTCDSLAAVYAAQYLAKKYSCVVVISGATDIVVDTKRKCCLYKSTFSFFPKITAMGCSATAIIGAFAAITKDYFLAAVQAMVTLGLAGENAMQDATGPGSFYTQLLDFLHKLNKEDFVEQPIVTDGQNTDITLTPKYLEKRNIDYSLYLIADCNLSNADEISHQVAAAVAHGVSCVQLRGKTLSQQQLIKVGRTLQRKLKPLKIPLIINDSIDVAQQIDADGVHLGQKDSLVALAREKLGAHKIIGLSLENEAQAYCCANLDVDYFGVGPVFVTTTKQDASSPLGIQGLQKIKTIINTKPIIAIGGINAANLTSVLDCNVGGIAVASAILDMKNPTGATQQLRCIIDARRHYHCVLSIAGSDSSGGAGVQADIKTISATGGYAASVITALTAQNTLKVAAIYDVSAQFVGEQLNSVFEDIHFSAVKIGMLHRADIITVIATKLQKSKIKNIVLDPVMVAKSGDKLITDDALQALQIYLLPLAYLITPNLPEAEIILQCSISSTEQMEQAAKKLANKYHTNVLIKGGHHMDDKADDVLFSVEEQKIFWFCSARYLSNNTHGTGCTLSAAIASYLAQGNNLVTAIGKAKDYLSSAIKAGSNYFLGHGHGPVDHFYGTRNC